MSGITPLKIEEQSHSILQDILEYAGGESVAECLQNIFDLGDEGHIGCVDGEMFNRIDGIDGIEGGKIAIANPTSIGKNKGELLKLLQINSSSKTIGIEEHQNHGAGFKKAGMADSPAGVITAVGFEDEQEDVYLTYLCREGKEVGLKHLSKDNIEKELFKMERKEFFKMFSAAELTIMESELEKFSNKEKPQGTYIEDEWGAMNQAKNWSQFTIQFLIGKAKNSTFMSEYGKNGGDSLNAKRVNVLRAAAPDKTGMKDAVDLASLVCQKFPRVTQTIKLWIPVKGSFPRVSSLKGVFDYTQDERRFEWKEKIDGVDSHFTLSFDVEGKGKLKDKGVRKQVGFLSGWLYRNQIMPQLPYNAWTNYAPLLGVTKDSNRVQLLISPSADVYRHSKDRTNLISEDNSEHLDFKRILESMDTDLIPEEARKIIEEEHQSTYNNCDVDSMILDILKDEKGDNQKKKNKKAQCSFEFDPNGEPRGIKKTLASSNKRYVNFGNKISNKNEGGYINHAPTFDVDEDTATSNGLMDRNIMGWMKTTKQIIFHSKAKPLINYVDGILKDVKSELDYEVSSKVVKNNCLVAIAKWIKNAVMQDDTTSEIIEASVNSEAFSNYLRSQPVAKEISRLVKAELSKIKNNNNI
tara:strand:+ start:314 stop:2227 length:1914 start_codon:yes stop_codon:yes gene_type:complete